MRAEREPGTTWFRSRFSNGRFPNSTPSGWSATGLLKIGFPHRSAAIAARAGTSRHRRSCATIPNPPKRCAATFGTGSRRNGRTWCGTCLTKFPKSSRWSGRSWPIRSERPSRRRHPIQRLATAICSGWPARWALPFSRTMRVSSRVSTPQSPGMPRAFKSASTVPSARKLEGAAQTSRTT